jgi:choline dehydrogenase-like flavoprotein
VSAGPSGDDDYDVVIVGSGFGGTMAAHELLRAGLRVAMVERCDWVERGPHNWEQASVGTLTPYYSMETPYRALAGGERDLIGAFFCVGGPSVFYGGVSLRFRERDFEPAPEIVTDSGAEWPVGYADLEPWYSAAERIIGVAGEPGADPTEPPRSAPYPQLLGALSPISRRITQAARGNGLHPFRLPLAFNHAADNGRAACAACPTCDGFACAIGAKNDLATAVLPRLVKEGLVLRPNTVAVRLVKDGQRVTALECVERRTGAPVRFLGRQYILAAGTLASPHLLLASGLEEVNPAGALVGRFMTRHFNAIAMGLFPRRPDHVRQFHKQVGIHDFYFGHPGVSGPRGKLGGIQQLVTPPAALVKQSLPRGVGQVVAAGIPHMTGLLVMAEDQPQRTNGVTIDPSRRDAFGLPQLQVSHHYTERDRLAGGVLLRQAKRVLRTAGAWIIYVHEMRSFSHAVGTVRMGTDARTSPLDRMCLFRGLDNLYVADASCFPTAAGVNPSLTIAANALRVGAHVAARLGRGELARPA